MSRAGKLTSREYPAVTRMLLATDGSFTLLLEALLNQSIVAEPLQAQIDQTDPRILLLQSDKNDILFRAALLKCRESGETAAYVEVITNLGLLSESIRNELENATNRPIGILLREERTETFREIRDWGLAQNDMTRQHLGKGDRPFRTYVIYSDRKPLMIVTEYLGNLLYGRQI